MAALPAVARASLTLTSLAAHLQRVRTVQLPWELSLNTLELLSKAYSNPLWVKGQSLVLLWRTDRIRPGSNFISTRPVERV
uniref:Secreted protein n=1 Tax=Globodera rostochiensis TaxID=31243 RepID=A0A914GVE3_GLORO